MFPGYAQITTVYSQFKKVFRFLKKEIHTCCAQRFPTEYFAKQESLNCLKSTVLHWRPHKKPRPVYTAGFFFKRRDCYFNSLVLLPVFLFFYRLVWADCGSRVEAEPALAPAVQTADSVLALLVSGASAGDLPATAGEGSAAARGRGFRLFD